MISDVLKCLGVAIGMLLGRIDPECAELFGGEVTLKGISKLKVREVTARTGHNPQNGQPIEIPATKKVGFIPFDNFKRALAG